MRKQTLQVQRFNGIPGIGAKVLNETTDVDQAETPEDILELFRGAPKQLRAFQIEQKARGNELDAAELSDAFAWAAVLRAVNNAKVREARSTVIEAKGGSDPKSAVATAKAAIRVMLNVYPGKSKAEVAQIVVTDELRAKLAEEGVEFGETKELRKKYKEQTEDDDDASESEDE